MKLFVGLGNPGDKYQRHRHNVGFMAVEEIARAHNFPTWRRKFQGFLSDGRIGSQRVLLLTPQTYMNESGQSVGEAARFLKIPEDDIVVFYDEIDLAPGKLKVKTGGGNAGHNGLRSISAHLGNDYQRVRIGVGHPGRKDLVSHHVLNDFSKADHEWLDPMLIEIAKAAGRLAQDDHSRFLTDVANALAPPKSDEPDKKADKTKATPEKTKADAERKPADTKSLSGALANNLQKWLKKTGGDS